MYACFVAHAPNDKCWASNQDTELQMHNKTVLYYFFWQEALQNPLVNQVVSSVLGTNPADLTSQLRTLNSVNRQQLDAMKTVAQLMYDASFCVSQYREEQFSDEATMLQQAQYYAERNELLAGMETGWESGGSGFGFFWCKYREKKFLDETSVLHYRLNTVLQD